MTVCKLEEVREAISVFELFSLWYGEGWLGGSDPGP